MPGPGALNDLRVIELADETGEFFGKLLSGSGADVVKIEPPGGSPTRNIGPFVDDNPHPERSIYFWHYNLGKRSVVLDYSTPDGAQALKRLASRADVIIDTNPPGRLEELGLGDEALRAENPGLIMVAISPFGRNNPYGSYKTSDLIHLAMGGPMDSTGYPRHAPPAEEASTLTDPFSPIAPQMWQAYHCVGTLAHMNLLAALLYRDRTGRGQFIDMSIHEAVVYSTEGFMLGWTYDRLRRARGQFTPLPYPVTKDGKYIQMGLILFPHEWGRVVAFLDKNGMAEDLTDPKYADGNYRAEPEVGRHVKDVLDKFIASWDADDLFHASQKEGLVWCPVHSAEGNLEDPHLIARNYWKEVDHPELGRTFQYPRGPWEGTETSWQVGPRAPLIGEHTDAVLSELGLAGSRSA